MFIGSTLLRITCFFFAHTRFWVWKLILQSTRLTRRCIRHNYTTNSAPWTRRTFLPVHFVVHCVKNPAEKSFSAQFFYKNSTMNKPADIDMMSVLRKHRKVIDNSNCFQNAICETIIKKIAGQRNVFHDENSHSALRVTNVALLADDCLTEDLFLIFTVRGIFFRRYDFFVIWQEYCRRNALCHKQAYLPPKKMSERAAKLYAILRRVFCKLVADLVCCFTLILENEASTSLMLEAPHPHHFQRVVQECGIKLKNSIPILCDTLQNGLFQGLWGVANVVTSLECILSYDIAFSHSWTGDTNTIFMYSAFPAVCHGTGYYVDSLYVKFANATDVNDVEILAEIWEDKVFHKTFVVEAKRFEGQTFHLFALDRQYEQFSVIKISDSRAKVYLRYKDGFYNNQGLMTC